MKNLQRMCGATVLTCLLAVSASAGDMLTPGVTDPPPPPPSAASETAKTEGDIPFGVTSHVMAALLGLLFVI